MTNSVLAGAKSIGQHLFGGYAELLRIPHTARFSVGSVIACMPFPMVGMTITISVQHYYGNYSLAGALTEQDAQKLETLGVRYMIRKPCKLQAVAACVRKMLAAVQEMSHLSSDAEALIDGVLRELGVPGVLKGCRYLREAALLAAGDLAGAGLEDLYAHVAEASHTTASRVERAIGHAIAIAWGGDAELLPSCGITSLACGRMPTNADCIAHLAGQLQSQRKTALPC